MESPELRASLKRGERVVFSIWHGDEMALLAFAKKYRVATMTSTSRDGDIMNHVLAYFGFRTSRGSSTRGGARALAGVLRLAREGYNPVVAIDGPRGPRHRAKPGVFEISRHLQAPIFAAGLSCSKKFVFERSWNKGYLPLPFATVTLFWSSPFLVGEEFDSRDPQLAQSLESEMLNVHEAATKLIATS